ncbi:MAG: hypothetical protein M1814_000238 [Vezdaea aestivalis]|nr:MAG: hypothetical protein M1814_000238 [Vezdaea aestivalis]
MPSPLRLQTSIDSTASTAGRFLTKSPSSPPNKRQKMSVSQTYLMAHTARNKLSRAAARPDHDLRLLVGHANLLDGLMLELADAEREQEAWFDSAVSKASSSDRHVQWADSAAHEADWEAESDSSDEEEEDDEEEFDLNAAIAPRKPAVFQPTLQQLEDVEEYEDDEQDVTDLALYRTTSHSHSPPELLADEDSSSSDEDNTPPSPPTQSLQFSEKEQQSIATEVADQAKQNLSVEEQQTFFDEGYYLPQRAAISAF